MKAYGFTFDGSYVGPFVIVVAKNKEEATVYAKEQVKANNYNPETVKFEFETQLTDGAIVYYNSGEY